MGKTKKKLQQPEASPAGATRPEPKTRLHLIVYAVLFVTTLLVYAPVLSFDFVNFDDPDYVTRNAHVRAGFTAESVSWAFTSGEAANWFPVTRLSHMLDYQMFGLRSGLQHFTSALIHALAALLLFAFLRRATGVLWPSAFVAFLFALHPLHVESVAWISERKDVLSAFFWFLALWSYVRYAEKRSWGWFLFVLFSFGLGLMSKPMIVTLPFVLLLLDVWPLRRPLTQSTLLEKIPFLALAGGAAVFTYLVQQSSGAVRTAETFPVGMRIENALVSYVTYLVKMCWPARLAVFYPYPSHLPVWQVLLAAALLAGVSGAVVRYFRDCPYLAVGWCWYLGTLVPVIGLVQVGAQAHADRFTYVPMIGIGIMVAWGSADILKRWPRARMPLAGLAVLACLSSVALCAMQIQYWKNSETLFRHAAAVTDGNYLAHHNLGVALSTVPGHLPEAISEYRTALAIKPDSARALTDLGNALSQFPDRLPEAVADYQEALLIEDAAVPHYDLANTLSKIPGRLPEAIVHYEAALREKPDYLEARVGLANALTAIPDRRLEAIPQYQEALRVTPDSVDLHYGLALLLAKMGRMPEAIPHFEAVLQRKPEDVDAHNNIGVALASLGRQAEAISHFEAALRVDPNSADAHINLGIALSSISGRMPEAIAHFQAALEIRPDPEVRQMLNRLRGGR
jgi:protein O-mannosyl-transferase